MRPSLVKCQPIAAPADAPDLAALKFRQQVAWSSGDYAVIGTSLQIVGEELCEALDLRAGARVLDVAAGNGNASLAAARRWCNVVSTTTCPPCSTGRAPAPGPRDAEALPFEDECFDAVLSTFGAMFTPDQDKAAAEMLRVCRPGGRIGPTNWTPDGFVGEMFKILGRHLPPPPGARSPALWGTRERLAQLFGGSATIDAKARHFVFRYRSADHFLHVFNAYYGPVLKAFDALDPAGQQSLRRDLLVISGMNRATDGTMVVPGEYLEILIAKR